VTVTTIAYTGASVNYTVPAGVTYVTIECWGAQGATARGAGGLGGYAKGQLVVTPGTVLSVSVGGNTGGSWPGGGPGGAGSTQAGGYGGGYSGVSLAGVAVVMAGGGGGGAGGGVGLAGAGGYGGGAAGRDGYAGASNYGGGGGTQTTGYASGQGGAGTGGVYGGGGAGGGLHGGYGGLAGGAGAGGGGGGSGYLSSALYPGAIMVSNARVGAGQVVITAVSNPPLAPTLNTPTNNGYIINTEANDFGWVYNNVDPGEFQSKADFQYKKFGDVSWTTLTNVATTAGLYTLAASTWTLGFQYEWQVKTYGAFGAASPWSASSFTNTIASVPAPTISTPTTGTMEYATPVNMAWTLPGAFTQDAYQVQRTQNADGSGTLYYDSGIVVTTGQSALVPLDAAAGRTDWLRVAFRYNGHWSAWTSVDILCEFGPPNNPTLACAQVTGQPAVNIVITNPPAGGGYSDTILNDLYRSGRDNVTIRIAANLPPNSSFIDLLPGAGDNEYLAVAYAASGASAISITADSGAYADVYSDIYR